MNIVTSYFLVRALPGTIALGGDVVEHQQARQQEYLECLRRNQQHPDVASIHLLVEGADAYEHLLRHVMGNADAQRSTSAPLTGHRDRRRHTAPVVPVLCGSSSSSSGVSSMPLYSDFFLHANRLLPHRLTMVCNADVYLSPGHFSCSAVAELFRCARDLPCHWPSSPLSSSAAARPSSSAGEAAADLPKANALALALTRYESDHLLDAPFLYDYRGSHDAFVVVPPVPSSFLRRVAHPQNSYKAENVVLHELQRSGYVTLNPTLGDGARLVHRHAADLRQWFPPVDESRYALAPPSTVAQAASRIRDEVHARSSSPPPRPPV
ncbi:hypothetical protein NESM_000516500 [Novymonas esmeraldas]|uniref:Uncharacterized protein n=1 Tax=Novymonas esmeraldas TaxID=1808958 RepID=A0AAW0ERS7_9TRYP